MTKELQDELFEIAKEFEWFKSCYCIECDDGWFGLLEDLIDTIYAYSKNYPEVAEDFRIYQIKEKFGGLRFYWGLEYYEEGELKDYEAFTKDVEKLVSLAEEEAWGTCEACGEPGVTDFDRGWVKTYCEKHK